METGRFAPSTTGPAHPGTLLAALLCWLDARSRGARLVLRLEDLDPERSSPALALVMRDDLAWLGLDFDAVELQSQERAGHEQALDRLEAAGALYPCSCSRSRIREHGRRAPAGGFAYPNTCRARRLAADGWRATDEPLRARLPAGVVEPVDEAGEPLAQDPSAALGDPVVRRRGGDIAYQLASVVDDARAGVTRVVRGRDLASSTATQVALQRLLALPEPVYRHHMLLLEEREGAKLAKLHGAVGSSELRRHYGAAQLCGVLASACGLRERPDPVAPRELLDGFSWERVARRDRLMRWTGERLVPG
jgi:glutamyl/glutaminyl-tRNA synthetase